MLRFEIKKPHKGTETKPNFNEDCENYYLKLRNPIRGRKPEGAFSLYRSFQFEIKKPHKGMET